jgi:hypothetical protein
VIFLDLVVLSLCSIQMEAIFIEVQFEILHPEATQGSSHANVKPVIYIVMKSIFLIT